MIDSPEPESDRPRTVPSAVASQRGRVLIVDDSEDNRVLLRAFLKSAVALIDEAEDGLAGLELFRRNRYDLVIMDMHMPVMDGLATTRAMRAFERATTSERAAILALTADDSSSDRERSRSAGCDQHLVKPVSKAALLDAVAAKLSRRTQ